MIPQKTVEELISKHSLLEKDLSSGNIDKVLKESLCIAKINAFSLFNKDQIKAANMSNVHLHLVEASSKKDGPSAGIAICMAYYSLITG